MKKLLKKLFSIKTLWSLSILAIVFLVPVFAQWTITPDPMETTWILFHEVISFLSWAWVFFAVLAGKLMSNDFVYGSFMNMDVFLWQVWNVMKNFANYVIGALFLVWILKIIFSMKDEVTDFFKTKIVAFLVAWVLIQMSRFLLGALLDISTITTSAIWSFPAAVIEWNSSLQWDLAKELECLRGLKVSWDAQASNTQKFDSNIDPVSKCVADWDALSQDQQTAENKSYLDSILPSHNSLSGPLLFMWLSIFRFQNFSSLDSIKKGNRERLVITTWVQMLLMVIFSVALMALFIINIIRVVALWIIIVFSPFLILVAVLNGIGWMNLDFIEKSKNFSWLNIKYVIKLVFAPVIFTAFLSLMLIFTFSVRWLLTAKNDITLNDMTFTTVEDTSTIEIDWIASSTIEWLKTWFVDLLIYFAIIFLLWKLLRIAIDTITDGWPPIMWKILWDNGIMWWLQKLSTSIPILPWPNGKWMSISWAWEFMKQQNAKTKRAFGLDDNTLRDQEDALRESIWLKTRSWRDDYTKALDKDITNNKWSNFFTKSKEYAKIVWGISITTPWWRSAIENYLKNTKRDNTKDFPLMTGDNIEEYFKGHTEAVENFSRNMGNKVNNLASLSKTKFTGK